LLLGEEAIAMKKRLVGTLMAFAVASLGMTAIARAAEDQPTVKMPKEWTLDCGKGVSMKRVLIPAGEFMMGSPENEGGRDPNEGPRHRVKITKPFFMGIYAVTQAQYEAVMGANPSFFKGESNPVEMVSWNGAGSRFSRSTCQSSERPAERRAV
jgi:formylglycine-generating enzyme required for sulfatase activity